MDLIIRSGRIAATGWLLTLCALVVACSLNVSQGSKEQDLAHAERAVRVFHERLSSQQYGEIVGEADERLRQSKGDEELVLALRSVRERLGGVRSIDASRANVVLGTPVEIRAVYNVTFENGEATEFFVFVRRGDAIKLADYRVQPGRIPIQ